MNPQHQSQEVEDDHLEKNINNPPVNTNDHKKICNNWQSTKEIILMKRETMSSE